MRREGYGVKTQDAIAEFMVDLSAPLKRMKSDWLNQITENCYKEEHLSDTSTNIEQIVICKDEHKNELFGKFQTMLNNHRVKNQTRL